MHCAFCDAAGDLSPFGTLLHEDGRAAVLLHPDAAVAGHAMLVWKRHVENVAGLEPAELQHFARVQQAAERALLAVTRRERAILLKLGIQTPHLHLHIYPVAASASREEVMAAIGGRTSEKRGDGFARECARALTELWP